MRKRSFAVLLSFGKSQNESYSEHCEMENEDVANVIFGDFEWNDAKASENLKKHQVLFEESISVFHDPFSIIFHDPDHSFEENRLIIVGMSVKIKYLFVSFTERGNRTRIISARELSASEKRNYEQKKHKF